MKKNICTECGTEIDEFNDKFQQMSPSVCGFCVIGEKNPKRDVLVSGGVE